MTDSTIACNCYKHPTHNGFLPFLHTVSSSTCPQPSFLVISFTIFLPFPGVLCLLNTCSDGELYTQASLISLIELDPSHQNLPCHFQTLYALTGVCYYHYMKILVYFQCQLKTVKSYFYEITPYSSM